MKVFVETIFDCPAEEIWREVQKSSLLIEVMKPLARISPIEPERFPDRWERGQTIRCFCWILWIVPIGIRRLHIERIDEARHEIQSRESDHLIRKWDHLIKVESVSGGKTRYSDCIEIDAGILTPIVWTWAMIFYKHRQRRWRSTVVPRLLMSETIKKEG